MAASCAHPRATSPATTFAPPKADPTGGAAMYALVHVDHLQAGGLGAFAEARRRWVGVLSQASTTDGRGLYLQTGDSGFLSLRPLRSLGELDRQPPLVTAALSGVDPEALRRYDAASDALLAPPHRSEVWRFDEELSYGTTDPIASLAAAAWGKMSVEEIDPTPAGEGYRTAWKEVRAALEREGYPLVRVAYWSRYGTGNLVSFWLAGSQRQFLDTRPVEAAVAHALGDDEATLLLARLQKTVLASDSVDVIPRLDLSTKAL